MNEKILISKKLLKEIVDGSMWRHADKKELDEYVNGWFDNIYQAQQEVLKDEK